ncbi:hypothetical protein V1512DRAFT_268196 [Lipomyces arxii]|uniref:uncharacterized protein n=1 Tax=Lipomyces arxii TaxID=56418 RepID=UPI0034CDE293
MQTLYRDKENCSICLSVICAKDLAILQPCHHHFDLSCISRWLRVSIDTSCPLCKTVVNSISFDHGVSGSLILANVFKPPPRIYRRERLGVAREEDNHVERSYRLALKRRRYVYINHLTACYVGSNKKSGYTKLPVGRHFNAEMQTRARSFIRRELGVFPFLLTSDPYRDNTQTLNTSSTSREIEFLTVYVISLLQLVDVQTAEGADMALNIISDYLGRPHASIFLHELCAFLRSPCKSVVEYDRIVQYRKLGRLQPEEYGQRLIDLSERKIDDNERRYGRDAFRHIPRAYSMRRR